ncbi:MAG: transposase [Planctomycetes bacterium]|nr:transposase [Planctomycetota bacterium]
MMRLPLFQKPGDYDAFQRIMAQGLRRPDVPLLLGWCLMPNHWHLILLPKPCRQGQSQSNLSTWMQWLTVPNTHRWHQQYHNVGLRSAVPGAVQGRGAGGCFHSRGSVGRVRSERQSERQRRAAEGQKPRFLGRQLGLPGQSAMYHDLAL